MSRRLIFGSSAIHVWVHVRSLRSKPFPGYSPNPNEWTHEKSLSVATLMHESQRFWNKADDLYLTTLFDKYFRWNTSSLEIN